MVHLTNRTNQLLIVDWKQSAYIDEKKRSHPVYHRGKGSSDSFLDQRATEIPAQAKVMKIAAPVYKTYDIREHCFSETEWYEPLLPSDLAEVTAASARDFFERLETEKVPIQLRLHVLDGDRVRRYDLIFLVKQLY